MKCDAQPNFLLHFTLSRLLRSSVAGDRLSMKIGECLAYGPKPALALVEPRRRANRRLPTPVRGGPKRGRSPHNPKRVGARRKRDENVLLWASRRSLRRTTGPFEFRRCATTGGTHAGVVVARPRAGLGRLFCVIFGGNGQFPASTQTMGGKPPWSYSHTFTSCGSGTRSKFVGTCQESSGRNYSKHRPEGGIDVVRCVAENQQPMAIKIASS